jgi:hypothetical protein
MRTLDKLMKELKKTKEQLETFNEKPNIINSLEKAKVDEGASPIEKLKIRRARTKMGRDSMVDAERQIAATLNENEVKPRKLKSGERPDFISQNGKPRVRSSGISKDGVEVRAAIKPKKKGFFKEEDCMEKEEINEADGEMNKAESISPEQQKANKAKSIAERNKAAMKQANINSKSKQPAKSEEQTTKPNHLRVIKSQEIFDTLVKSGHTESALLLKNWGEEDSVAKACRELLEKQLQ